MRGAGSTGGERAAAAADSCDVIYDSIHPAACTRFCPLVLWFSSSVKISYTRCDGGRLAPGVCLCLLKSCRCSSDEVGLSIVVGLLLNAKRG